MSSETCLVKSLNFVDEPRELVALVSQLQDVCRWPMRGKGDVFHTKHSKVVEAVSNQACIMQIEASLLDSYSGFERSREVGHLAKRSFVVHSIDHVVCW